MIGMKHILNIPRSEAVALVTSAVELMGDVSASDAIRLKRQAEEAPVLAFGMNDVAHDGRTCACPALRAGLSLSIDSAGDRFAQQYDALVCDVYGLEIEYDYGVLVIE